MHVRVPYGSTIPANRHQYAHVRRQACVLPSDRTPPLSAKLYPLSFQVDPPLETPRIREALGLGLGLRFGFGFGRLELGVDLPRD